jgi:hypothetical protein
MSRASALARGQLVAELSMIDACVIDRAAAGSQDDFSGTVTPAYTVVYTGKCRIQQERHQAEPHDAGQDYILLQRTQLQLPMSVVGVQVRDRVTVTVSRDPDLVGRSFLVLDLAHKTDATARRITVTERTN